MTERVRVTGLDELRRELRKLDDKGLIDELKATNYEVATDVVEGAKRRASTVSRQADRAASSLRASRTAARAQVLIGSAAVPFALGAEFGSMRYKQFPGWRGNGEDAGYFLWPEIRDQSPDIVEKYGDAMERISSRAFNE